MKETAVYKKLRQQRRIQYNAGQKAKKASEAAAKWEI